MFPEHRDLITRLRTEDARFARLFEEHNELDHKIIRLQQNPVTGGLDSIDDLKRQKLRLKDELYQIIKEYEDKENAAK